MPSALFKRWNTTRIMRNLVFIGEGKADVFDIILIIFERHIQENVLYFGKRKDAFHERGKSRIYSMQAICGRGFNRTTHVAKMMGTLFPCAFA